jgi:uncharacterized membrane protein YphA (DoxX/SURF4 family)
VKRWTLVSIRFVLGLVFLSAGLSKLGDPLRVLASIYSYQTPVPDIVASAIAHGLPWLEILLGLALLSGLFLRVTASLAAGLLGVFFILTAQAWWRELPIDCGCIDLSALHPSLAILSTPLGAALRNLVLLALALTLLRPLSPKTVEKNVNSP